MNSYHKIQSAQQNPTALIAPLDWGLGHATRCIPIIEELYHQNFNIIIAADGSVYSLLKEEFPNADFLIIDNYNIQYSRKKSTFSRKIILQLPKIRRIIRSENKWLAGILRTRKIDFIISDNRPGLHNKNAYCIYITHQLNFKTRHTAVNRILSNLHRRFILKFDECWIPDNDQRQLSGKLSLFDPKKINARFIGPISRFEVCRQPIQFDIAIILSGPEPQRTLFENKLLSQLPFKNLRIILIRGLPGERVARFNSGEHPDIVNFMPASQLNKTICSANLIICRSGYTSIMDLAKLNKKAVLVPTPGQPEQEYLAAHLHAKEYFMMMHQDDFNLERAWQEAGQFSFKPTNCDFDTYKKNIGSLLHKNV